MRIQQILRVRGTVLCLSSSDVLHLPEPLGPVVMLSEKMTIPTKEFPNFNFIGRLLGPRGMTAKQVELDTGCKILVRGHGSLRDKHKEEQMKGKPKWEHLNEELHVLITVEDSINRATLKLRRATEEVKKLLYPVPECEDELKKRQLIELAILNGTYRGLNRFILPTAATCTATGTPPFETNVFGSNVALGPSLPMPPHLTFGPSTTPMMLPLKPAEQHGLPILFAPPAPATIYSGQLTPLTSPGQTPIQSPEIIGSTTSPLLIQGDNGLMYVFDPYVAYPQPSSLTFEYSMALAPQSSSIGLSHGQ